jgi:hypothetical protein
LQQDSIPFLDPDIHQSHGEMVDLATEVKISEPDPIIDQGYFVWKDVSGSVENIPQGQAKPPSISAILTDIS